MKKIFDFFVFTSLFIACCAILMVYQAFLLFGTSFSPVLYAFVFFGAVCSYNFHWFLAPPGNPGVSYKYKWNLTNRNVHLFLAFIGLVGAIVCSFLLLEHWVWLVLTALFTFLYSAPMIPFTPFVRLRKVAVGKTIYLAMAWAHITAALPFLIELETFTAEHLWYVANRFCFIYAICIVFDRRDREGDRRAGVKSLVTWLSEQGIDRLFWFSQIGALVTNLVLLQWLSVGESIALFLPAAIMGLLYQRSKKSSSDYLYYFLLDGLMALSAPILILVKFAR